jgi:hypothetical protein
MAAIWARLESCGFEGETVEADVLQGVSQEAASGGIFTCVPAQFHSVDVIIGVDYQRVTLAQRPR